MNHIKYLAVLLLMITVISACSSQSSQDKISSQEKSSDTITQQKKNYEGAGMVISIPPNKKMIVIRHGVIPGFMDAMTMPFNVSDSSILTGIQPKDSIRLFIEYDGNRAVLAGLKIIR